MFEKRKARNRSLKQWTRPHRSRFTWMRENITPVTILKWVLIVFCVLYFAGFAVAVSVGETTGNPVKMVKIVASVLSGNNGEQKEETEANETTEAPTTEAATTEAPTTEAPTTEAPTTEAPTTEAATQAVTTTAETSQAASSQAAESSQAASSSAETTKAAEIDANATYATIYTNEGIPVKLRSEAQIPLDDKTANIVAEVTADAKLKVKVLGDAGEANGHKWSKVELIEDLKSSDQVTIADGVLLKAGTVCYVCTTYLKTE